MGDVGEDYRALDQFKKDRHAQWKELNMKAIEKSGLKYEVKNLGESVLFRLEGKPKADFFPSTGRWRVAGRAKTYRGGAISFLTWYANQKVS